MPSKSEEANRYRGGCLVFILVGALVLVGGCGWVANPRSKLATEAKKQTQILERIAVALEGGVCENSQSTK